MKLFVEALNVVPLRQGRGTAVTADLALLNERAEGVAFDTGENRLEMDGESAHPDESHVLSLRPGEITRVSLTFKTRVPPEEIASGVLEVVVGGRGGGQAKFAVPFSALE